MALFSFKHFSCSKASACMELTVRTTVQQPYLKVKEGFNEVLFSKLNPPFPIVKLQRFDGCQKGDVVDMELEFIVFQQRWESLITDDDTTEDYFFFQDEGRQLPFFLKNWRHRHWVKRLDEQSSQIIDNVHYSTGNYVTDLVMYPVMLSQFLYRQPIYRRFFK